MSEFDRKQTQTSTNEHVAKTESKRKIRVHAAIRRKNTALLHHKHVRKSVCRGEEKKRRRKPQTLLVVSTRAYDRHRSFTKISVIWNLQILAYFIHIVCRRHKKTLYSRALKEYKFARTIVKGVIVKKKAISCKHDQQKTTHARARSTATETQSYRNQLIPAIERGKSLFGRNHSTSCVVFCRLLKRVEYLLE